MFKHVLIPTDGSGPSKKAAKAGIAFAKAIGARITTYHALEEHQPIYNARFRKDLEMNKQLVDCNKETGSDSPRETVLPK